MVKEIIRKIFNLHLSWFSSLKILEDYIKSKDEDEGENLLKRSSIVVNKSNLHLPLTDVPNYFFDPESLQVSH